MSKLERVYISKNKVYQFQHEMLALFYFEKSSNVSGTRFVVVLQYDFLKYYESTQITVQHSVLLHSVLFFSSAVLPETSFLSLRLKTKLCSVDSEVQHLLPLAAPSPLVARSPPSPLDVSYCFLSSELSV